MGDGRSLSACAAWAVCKKSLSDVYKCRVATIIIVCLVTENWQEVEYLQRLCLQEECILLSLSTNPINRENIQILFIMLLKRSTYDVSLAKT